MERICEQRKADGLHSLAVQWGAVGDVGVFHRTMKNKKVFGLAPQSLKSCLETLDLYLQQDKTVVSSFIPFHRTDAVTVDSIDSLVHIAANILGIKDVKKINPKTTLVDLGMDSLMAAELGLALQSRANIYISQKEYIQMTFERLAEIDGNISAPTTSDNSKSLLLVKRQLALQSPAAKSVSRMESLGTSKDLVFFVHPVDGTTVMLEEMVKMLEATCYGIECVKEAPLVSIEKLAAYYIKKLKEFQPTGPYKIAGYSFGGTVAFEMALQLEKDHETVSLLLLLDASPTVKQYLENTGKGESTKREWEDKVIIGYLIQYKSNLSASEIKELSSFQTAEEKILLAGKLMQEAYPDFTPEELSELIASCVARAECFQAYKPADKVKAKSVLLKATMTDSSKNADHDYGLSDVCENPVEVIEVQGNHNCFYENAMELGIPAILNKIIS
jgi:fatty acid synthase